MAENSNVPDLVMLPGLCQDRVSWWRRSQDVWTAFWWDRYCVQQGLYFYSCYSFIYFYFFSCHTSRFTAGFMYFYMVFIPDFERIDRRVQRLLPWRPDQEWLVADGRTQEALRDPVRLCGAEWAVVISTCRHLVTWLQTLQAGQAYLSYLYHVEWKYVPNKQSGLLSPVLHGIFVVSGRSFDSISGFVLVADKKTKLINLWVFRLLCILHI